MLRLLILLLLFAIAGAGAGAGAADGFFLRPGQRFLILGDSNTAAGGYVQFLEAFLYSRFPEQRFEILNLGLPSETVTGLSEPDHPWPRPDVHERLERALDRTKPDVVVACYGMNDGIYYPFSRERFSKYQDGIRRLIDRVRQSRARLVLLTPPPFDPEPVRDKLLPLTAPKFSWMAPYAEYDGVLKRYSDWLLTLRSAEMDVVDLRTPILRHVEAVRKGGNPAYRLSDDGVHLNAVGHQLIAEALLRAWHAPTGPETVDVDWSRARLTKGRGKVERTPDGHLRLTFLSRVSAWPAVPGAQPVGRQRLVVRGAPRCQVADGQTSLGSVTAAKLAEGVDLTAFRDFSPNRRGGEVLKLVQQRERLLSPAWLTAVGHKRPDTPKGLPLEEAQAQARKLDEQIRALAKPVPVTLVLTPAGA